MELSKKQKKQNEINVLAKYLRRSIGNMDDLKQAVNVLFKGEAELSVDNDEQFVIYTGHRSGDGKSKPVYSTSGTFDFLDADQ
tara:strand:+ start:500 stop:748 length:249 start_codon:yes stop_codon:yes gene_type:complete